MKNEKLQSIELVLAGKLATAARRVIICDVKNLSKRIEEMEFALDNYDNMIMDLVRNEQNEKQK